MDNTVPVSTLLTIICFPYGLFVGIPPLLLTIKSLFVPPFDPVLFGSLIGFYGVILGFFWILKLLESRLNRYYRENQVSLVRKDKINLLVGFGGIIICTIIPRLAVCFVDRMVLSRISSLAILCILLFTAVFLTYSRKTISELNYDNHFYTVIWLLGIHALLFIISISMVWGIEDLVISVFITQIVFGISSLSSTLDFIVVWNDGFILDTPRAPVETPNAIQTETSKESITDFLAITLGCLSILTLVHGFRVLGEETVLMVFVGCAVVFGVIWGSAELLRGISERRKMLVGLGAMGIIGFVPRIVHGVLVEANMSNLFISTIITLSLTLSIYYHFIYSNRSLVFHFQYEAHETIITKFIVIHSIILIAMIRISYGYWANEELEVIIFSQLAFFLLPLTSSIDFWMMWEDAAVLENEKTKVTVRKTLKRVVKKTVVKLRPPKVTCFSCHQGYDEDRRTPRILKECGHTICEQCVNNLLAKNHWKHLFCPKCRMVTVVKGTANTLMKNFLALELVEEAGSM